MIEYREDETVITPNVNKEQLEEALKNELNKKIEIVKSEKIPEKARQILEYDSELKHALKILGEKM